jgi:branched-chain amino acid transport system substrate-binding protein
MTTSRKPAGATRRSVLAGMGAGAATLAMPSIVRASGGTIKVGYVTPGTGPMALFGETDGFAVETVRKALANGLEVNGERYNVEILVRDSQSDSNRAAEVAGDLILNEEVHFIIPASTTPTITAVADQAELFETPCVSTAAPWQAIIFPRGGGDTPFNWTYHFFWGLDEALRTFVGLWNTLETNRKVGMLFPQNIDGDTFGNEEYGLPAPTRAAGFEVTKPGFFQPAPTTSAPRSRPSRARTARSSAASPSSTTSRPS